MFTAMEDNTAFGDRGFVGKCKKGNMADDCNGNGDCTFGDNEMRCLCHPGFTGTYCKKTTKYLKDK